MDTAGFMASVEDVGEQVSPKIEEAKHRLRRINGRITAFIQDHPGACLLGAITLGYLVARLARHEK